MSFRFLTEIVTPVVGVLGGLFLLVRAVFPGTRSCDSKQLRVALGFAGASALGWGTLGLVDHSLHSALGEFAHRQVHHFKDLLAGSALGILVLQFASGEFRDSYRRYKELRRRRPETGPDRNRAAP